MSLTEKLGQELMKNIFFEERKIKSGIMNHPSWRDKASLYDATEMLKGKNPFTYLTTVGDSENHFYIFFVKEDLSIGSKNIVVVFQRGHWIIKNGTGVYYDNLDDLIAPCLKVKKGIPEPVGVRKPLEKFKTSYRSIHLNLD